ncbi:TetR/AcrR family transcriptional regulator [Actinacidiphila sp. bgisy145]|uniref:TetR/AcrR family transcriptional regulator n=1 Tax=Actinacidiphila sp. bgisy145 TaxID=3413792 RepID=UPI003EBECC4D
MSKAVGSMWCAYLFAGLCFIGLPDAISGGTATLTSWVAQNFLQLVLLSVMMVAQNAEAEAAERRSAAMYEAMYADAELLLRQEERTAERIAAQSRAVAAIARELGIDLADIPDGWTLPASRRTNDRFLRILDAMPKVSQQHLDARRAEILAAARRCFLRDGFHATSMQDLLVEAGLSAGAVYRYFASKQDMIAAIAEENLREVVAEVDKVVNREPAVGIGELLADLFRVIEAKHEENGFAAMALLVWSESLRDPRLAERIRATLTQVTAELARIVRASQETGDLPPDVAAEPLTQVIVATVPGYILQLASLGSGRVSGLPDAVRAVWPDRSASAR